VILLNPPSSEYYEATKAQAMAALSAYPKGLQIGGGITAENAKEYLEAGASHVIVTSYVFKNGQIHWENMRQLKETVGKERIVIDLSCRKKENDYYIVTDRWQKFTEEILNEQLLERFRGYCDEFLVHAVDVEGKSSGIEQELVKMLGQWEGIPITYAGGVSSFEDLQLLKKLGQNKIDVTIGSALDLFGGCLEFDKVRSFCDEKLDKE
jgi:phosphoribosylformimino-5-aminoimidazole carboxamide ribotide isomerase